ncbi:oligosaccharide flippase family protein, partial [Vibrio parahaemolyticus]|nr:oligosaccharide flippase family protein [Vibrio parahaemolyticus]
MLRKAIKNVSFLWMGSILGAIISFVTQAILAKSLGTEFYGLFSAALATINLIVPLAGFGVAAFWLKAFGQEGWGATRWLIPSFKFTFISSSILFLLMLTWSIQGPNDSNTARLLVILSVMLYGLSLQELFFSKLQLEEKYSSYALWQLFIPLFRFVSIYTLAIKNSLSIENVAIIYIVPSIISLLV